MAPPALQKALVDTVNFEAVIQTASVLTLCGKISKVIELLRIRSDLETPPTVAPQPPITTLEVSKISDNVLNIGQWDF